VAIIGGARSDTTYPTEAEAQAVAQEARRQLGQDGPTVGEIVDLFIKDAGTRCKPRTVDQYHLRLRNMLGPVMGSSIRGLSPGKAKSLYARLVASGQATDTHRNTLLGAKAWSRWCVKRRYMRADPFAEVEGVGRRKRGKTQLTVSESRKYLAVCLSLAPRMDAVAAMAYLLLGVRASELTDRQVRDLDDDGRLLWIPEAKTEAGKRLLEVPEILRPHLLALAEGKSPFAKLFDGRDRKWAWRAVRRMCKLAGVPVLCTHGARGTHTTIARSAGATAEVVAGALGHANTGVQEQHYVADGVSAIVAQRAAWRVLEGGRKPATGTR
jgi:integrase